MVSMSGYGQDGPWRDWSGYGMGLEPASGISSITGYQDGDPLRTGISFTDPYSGIVGAGAVARGARRPPPHRQRPVHRPLGAGGRDPRRRLRAAWTRR